ncbi:MULTISPECIES: hypothetical protein [Brevibacillus]|jgi:hypothetical protein|uniref:Uncharacterized protein n=1 Tax=Brevibacillus parabrevis TaxID=54914 RepID=A0A4Y3PN33_BREPA|nr:MULTISPECIES: hypothetical protein [Brevibacillus]MBU8715809.1 hypothetical protein [Brevibacillus parabrevis]MDH6352593.1 hypothetical protein [Brevibacillus sp. 1238]MDR4998137.1 hypothetical protein [Brevibacillus parabrevis]MED1726210.1 hypothetical protein [Brevibacillus parabrevis]MED2258073.1 hypothetical protein [Brevibacillus parabrevis]
MNASILLISFNEELSEDTLSITDIDQLITHINSHTGANLKKQNWNQSIEWDTTDPEKPILKVYMRYNPDTWHTGFFYQVKFVPGAVKDKHENITYETPLSGPF